MNTSRYQVVTYSRDIGEDERLDYTTKQSAIMAARKHLSTEDSAAVFDRKQHRYTAIFGDRWWFESENSRYANNL